MARVLQETQTTLNQTLNLLREALPYVGHCVVTGTQLGERAPRELERAIITALQRADNEEDSFE